MQIRTNATRRTIGLVSPLFLAAGLIFQATIAVGPARAAETDMSLWLDKPEASSIVLRGDFRQSATVLSRDDEGIRAHPSFLDTGPIGNLRLAMADDPAAERHITQTVQARNGV
ncbi:hypothetical protein [Agrobacterium sp. NPDC090283]|uniref:hypothetical protein n=1 Tax=Agrobacterium sp. NPDC090283 TaxID=3363920 RepID=UPI003839F0D9